MLTPQAAPVAVAGFASRKCRVDLRKPNTNIINVAARDEWGIVPCDDHVAGTLTFLALLWIAPNLLLAVLAVLMWRRGLHKRFPVFWIYALFEAIQWAILYPLDLLPSVAPETFWRAYWLSLLVEALVTFALVSEIFTKCFPALSPASHGWPSSCRCTGVLLVIVAAVTAAYAPIDNLFGSFQLPTFFSRGLYDECGSFSSLRVCGLFRTHVEPSGVWPAVRGWDRAGKTLVKISETSANVTRASTSKLSQ